MRSCTTLPSDPVLQRRRAPVGNVSNQLAERTDLLHRLHARLMDGSLGVIAPMSQRMDARVRADTFGTAPDRHFTAEWSGTDSGPSTLRVQAKIFESGVIEFHYCALATTGPTTEWITAPTQSWGCRTPPASEVTSTRRELRAPSRRERPFASPRRPDTALGASSSTTRTEHHETARRGERGGTYHSSRPTQPNGERM